MLAQAPGWAWAKGGRGGDNHATECCVDAQGNVYVAGYFYGATEVIGSDTLYNSGIEDIFLAKYSPEGVALWGRDIGGSNSEFCYGLVCDPQGNRNGLVRRDHHVPANDGRGVVQQRCQRTRRSRRAAGAVEDVACVWHLHAARRSVSRRH